MKHGEVGPTSIPEEDPKNEEDEVILLEEEEIITIEEDEDEEDSRFRVDCCFVQRFFIGCAILLLTLVVIAIGIHSLVDKGQKT